MCTVTLFPLPGPADTAFRMMVNRDEAHARPAALLPTVHEHGVCSAVYPTDPAGGGTWVAVNGAGLAATLLNLNLPDPPERTPDLVSRGGLIPSVMSLDSAEAAAEALQGVVTPGRQLPFRLVLADAGCVIMFRCDMDELTRHDFGTPQTRPWFTSSGLGDHLVQPPRRELFHKHFEELGDEQAAEAQLAFHTHRWPNRPELSVNMHRSDARTVSMTTVEVAPGRAWMSYHPAGPTEPADDVEVTL